MTLEQTVPIGFQELITAAQSLLVRTCGAGDRLEVSFSSSCRPTLHLGSRTRPVVALRGITADIFLLCYSPRPLEVQVIGLSLWRLPGIQLPPWFSSDLEY